MRALQQANFLMPSKLLDELRRAVPKGQQSKMVAQAVERELKRIRFLNSLERQFGAWAHEPHPELRRGVEQHIRRLRRSRRGTHR